jgi:hypothetical protein
VHEFERAPRLSRLWRQISSLPFGVEFFGDGFEVVSRIELGAKAAPRSLLDGAIDFPQALRRNAQCHDLPDAHHHVPGHDFDTGGWKRLVETLLPEFGIDLLEWFRLIMLEKMVSKNVPFGSEVSPLIRTLRLLD